ncbi:Phytoene dehydrogenase-related protein [Desulfatibacillum alkenivorans DSM 16219]|uniref:Pyridine nucleotide-disulfide oxidoreductase domain-containing protein 2 n=2 Tax=Desulfatibacillum alkenivorans TaxID=259354 RepID=A0A1M6Z3L1_9BACT|nr:Phytoene dehydrogenase-related protein [Desulfatibacillum alkenivorans DSM 16219]
MSGLCCAGYLGRAGLKTLVLEARGECGAHCESCEPSIPGFLHNLHTTWMITATSPAMGDLDLERFGMEFVASDIAYAKTFSDGKNALLCADPMETAAHWEKLSGKDASLMHKVVEHFLPEIMHIQEMLHNYLFCGPSKEAEEAVGTFLDEFFRMAGLNITWAQTNAMNGFELLDLMFESEHIKTMIQSLSWISGVAPAHRGLGALGVALLGLMTGPMFPVHLLKGGSHGATHALVKAAKAYGVKILPSCPVSEILVENGAAQGVRLAEKGIYGGRTITASKVVSNLTAAPTFLNLIGAKHMKPEIAGRIERFSYDEQNLLGVYYSLSGKPQFASSRFDEAINRCAMGYFGGDDTEKMKELAASLGARRIHDPIVANWFIPTIVDSSQAPPGCHTSFVWFDVPPAPEAWKNMALDGFASWDRIKNDLADAVTDAYESYAPGFKKLILDRVVYSPLDMFRNNPSAVHGNCFGGSIRPDQFYFDRPVPGVCVGGGARTFMENLYLSNSIHPFGASWMASGYIAACEVAEDFGIRDQSWWKDKAFDWLLANGGRIQAETEVAQ